MSAPLPYVDVEALLVGWAPTVVSARCLTELPADLEAVLPVVQFSRYGGADNRPGLDTALIDVDAYGRDRAQAWALSEATRAGLRFNLVGRQLAGAVVTRVDTLAGPSARPYDDSTLRRFGASYRLTLHIVA